MLPPRSNGPYSNSRISSKPRRLRWAVDRRHDRPRSWCWMTGSGLVVASRSFYDTFKVEAGNRSRPILLRPVRRRLGRSPPCASCLPTSYRRNSGRRLRTGHPFRRLGDRTLMLNARVVASQGDDGPTTLSGDQGHHRAAADRSAKSRRLLDETEALLRNSGPCSARCSTASPTACRSSPAS
jgi:hypothetical protein